MHKILHVATHAGFGGAGRAAMRIFESLHRNNNQVDFLSLTNHLRHPGVRVFEPAAAIDRLKLARQFLNLSKGIDALEYPERNPVSSEIVNEINNSDADIVNLHWVNRMLSIEDIGNITKPLVWTLHDMWAFCGEEHYSQETRWLDGYTPSNRAPDESGPDTNLMAWNSKVQYWKNKINLITPSNWLSECARRSALMQGWHTTIIPYPLDTLLWLPVEQTEARKSLGYNDSDRIVVFGAANGIADHIKGFDLLLKAMDYLKSEIGIVQLLVFGTRDTFVPKNPRVKVKYLGQINDDSDLRIIYSAADLIATPSRMESFCQIAAESNSCGTPVVAFDNSGITEIVKHKVTGYLAKAFDPTDFAEGMNWILNLTPLDRAQLRICARQNTIETLNYQTISSKYIKLYEAKILNSKLD